ncbi:hypothetical protein ACHMW6_03925 [Pseudoduganella sp. UC29_106]|uniref:hypothetical protein n=1 Tax=Pseudoduganella sp. UC29_106 TaxID=3374553 RepID=UPI0037567BF3
MGSTAASAASVVAGAAAARAASASGGGSRLAPSTGVSCARRVATPISGNAAHSSSAPQASA